MLGFLNAAFLFGLAAAAVPIIIHLLNRRRVRRIRFSSLEFLDNVNRQRMRRFNLRRILILILRTVAVLLIALAFARPTLRSASLWFPGNVPKNVIICLDASYSMGLEEESGTVFTAAKKMAKQIVDMAKKNDAMNVIVFSRRPQTLFEEGTRNKGLIKTAIDKAELTSETTSIRAAVDRAFELIETSEIEGGEIYVISDFRFNEDSTVVTADKEKENVQVYFLPVYEDAADNVSIDRVSVPRKLLRAGEVVRVGVSVTNHSRNSSVSFPLELSVDGGRKAEKVIELAPGASSSVVFPVSFASWGRFRCKVSKNRDRLPADDDRYFLLEISRSVPVTLMRGRRRTGPGAGSPAAGYFYLEKALNPRGRADAEFTVKTIDENKLTEAALPKNGVVIWDAPQRVDPRRLKLLERYVAGGGGLIVFLGGSDRAVWNSRRFMKLLGVSSVAEKPTGIYAAYESFQQDHPIFSIFNEEELELLARTRVRSYIVARGVAPDSVIAYTGGGDPAVFEHTDGDGRVLVFASSPDLESGDIPLSPMFLPLVHTSVSYLASAGVAQRRRETLAGTSITFDTEASSIGSAQLVIRDPSGMPIRPVLFETPQGETRVICERPLKVGFYQLARDTTVLAEAVVNVDTRESDTGTSSLPRKGPLSKSVVRASDNFADELQAKREGREIFAIFLFLALAALVTESILGRRG